MLGWPLELSKSPELWNTKYAFAKMYNTQLETSKNIQKTGIRYDKQNQQHKLDYTVS